MRRLNHAMALLLAAPLCAVGQPVSGAADPLTAIRTALQAGQADNALALLGTLPMPEHDGPEAHELHCRVELTLEHWGQAVPECEAAVKLEPQSSEHHLWLARALGNKADHANFMNAYSLAKRARSEWEEAVRLNPRNADALADLGEFYLEAPGVVGGGQDKAQRISDQLQTVDAGRAHELRGRIAEAQKDLPTAEHEFKLAVQTSQHPAPHWIALAKFRLDHKEYSEFESAIRSAEAAALRDRKGGAVALADGAALLIRAGRNLDGAKRMLEEYVAGPGMTEEDPGFRERLRLADLLEKMGDAAGASAQRQQAAVMASSYKPAGKP